MAIKERAAGFFNSRVGRGVRLASRLILGGIIIYAGYTKLRWGGEWHLGDYQFLFAISIDSYKMLPIWAVQGMARVLPWFEVALGVFLVLGVALRWVGSLAIALLLMFMVALVHAAILRLEICGCYGTNAVSPRMELLNDSGLMVLALVITVGAFLGARPRNSVA